MSATVKALHLCATLGYEVNRIRAFIMYFYGAVILYNIYSLNLHIIVVSEFSKETNNRIDTDIDANINI